MSILYPILLLALVGLLLLLRFPGGLCFYLFVICVILSGPIGLFGGFWLAKALFPDTTGAMAGVYIPEIVLALPFILPAVGVLSFLALYRGLALRGIALLERKRGVALAKPALKIGIIYAAICPFIVYGIAVLCRNQS